VALEEGQPLPKSYAEKQDELSFNKLVDSQRRATVREDARRKFQYRTH